jgi:hypothetical protein
MMRSWLSRWRFGKPRRVRPCLEALEDRRVPAVINPLPSTPDGAPGSLRADIIAANSNGQDNTIILQQGHYLLTLPNTAGQENAAATGDLDLTSGGHTITIQGVGADATVVDAGGIDRVFQVIGNVTVVFSNLTITGGRATDDGTAGTASFGTASDGGGILNNGGNVTLNQVLLQGNLAVGGVNMNGSGTGASGGGIWSNSTLTINNSTIENNKAMGGNGVTGSAGTVPSGEGGFGGFAQGGGLFISGGTVSLTATTLDSNQALGGNGGTGQSGVSGSPSGTVGGSAGPAEGGGLYLADGQVAISSSTLSANFAGGGTGGNGGMGVFAGFSGSAANGGDGWGGAILVKLGNLMLSNTTVAGNTAVGGTGGNSGGSGGLSGTGGMSLGGGLFLDQSATATIDNSTVAFNQALLSHGGAPAGTGGTVDGGAVFMQPGAILNAVSSIFGDNTVQGGMNPDISGNIVTAVHVLLADNSGCDLPAGSPDGNGNLVGTAANPIDPKLLPLDFYGGPTRTIALLADSPAIDAGLNPDGLTSDQRGFGPRSANGTADIGAFEFDATPIAPPKLTATSTLTPVFHALTARLVRVKHRTRLDVFDAATGALRLRVFPFGPSHGKEQLLMEDVNGDGVADIIVLSVQPHHLRVRVFGGRDLSDLTVSL